MQYIPAIIFAVLLTAIALLFSKGKGLWLIAGFNTMTSEERKEYHMAAIGKFLSKILVGLAVCLLVFDLGWYLSIPAINAFSWIAFGVIAIFALVYSCGNRFKKKEK